VIIGAVPVGIIMGAAVLGVLINRATIPQARVVFSDNCLLTSRNGGPCLILRIGNTRGNFLLNPEIRIGLLTVRLAHSAVAIGHGLLILLLQLYMACSHRRCACTWLAHASVAIVHGLFTLPL
jgi:hypothetical protein